jgi:hypothetical protein
MAINAKNAGGVHCHVCGVVARYPAKWASQVPRVHQTRSWCISIVAKTRDDTDTLPQMRTPVNIAHLFCVSSYVFRPLLLYLAL